MLKLQAKARLLAAPVGFQARKRLIQQIVERSPLLQSSGTTDDRGSWYSKEPSKDVAPVLEELKKLGWTKEVSREKLGAGPTVRVTRADGTWPLIVKVEHFRGKIQLDVDSRDTEGERGDADYAGLEAIAKKLLPTNRQGTMWRKSGGYAGEKTLRIILERAEKLGFKPVDRTSSGSPDGSYVGGASVLEKDGVVLNLSTNYGPTAHSNSYSASLSYDPHRQPK